MCSPGKVLLFNISSKMFFSETLSIDTVHRFLGAPSLQSIEDSCNAEHI